MNLSDLIFFLIDFFFDVVFLSFKRPCVLIFTVLLLKFVQLSVESINLMLFLCYFDVALLDVSFKLLHLSLFLLQLVDKIIQLLLEEFILRLGVQVIDADSRYLICDVFNLYFFL